MLAHRENVYFQLIKFYCRKLIFHAMTYVIRLQQNRILIDISESSSPSETAELVQQGIICNGTDLVVTHLREKFPSLLQDSWMTDSLKPIDGNALLDN